MILSSRKGIAGIIIPILIFGAFAVCIYYQSKTYDQMLTYGERPREMIEMYSFAEQARSYLQKSVMMSLNQAFYEVGESGGYATESICNDPIVHTECILERGGIPIDSFICDDEDIENKESLCSKFGVNNDYEVFEKNMVFTADCVLLNKHSIVCAEFDEADKYEYETDSGVKCVVLDGYSDTIETFPCYKGHTEKCDSYGVSSTIPESTSVKGEVLVCDISDEEGELYESFACYGELYEDCEVYGINSPGEHTSISLKLACEEASLSVICTESPCKTIANHSIWYDGITRCVPSVSEINDVVSTFFEAQFEKLLYKFEVGDVTLYHITDIELDLDLDSNKVISTPRVYEIKRIDMIGADPVIVSETVESYLNFVGRTNFTYIISPYFEVEIPYNPLASYPQIGEKAIGAVGSCSSDVECIKEEVKDAFGYSWNVSIYEGYALFDLEHKEYKAVSRTPNGEVIYAGLPVRFAVVI